MDDQKRLTTPGVEISSKNVIGHDSVTIIYLYIDNDVLVHIFFLFVSP